jgi:hypothetical protein
MFAKGGAQIHGHRIRGGQLFVARVAERREPPSMARAARDLGVCIVPHPGAVDNYRRGVYNLWITRPQPVESGWTDNREPGYHRTTTNRLPGRCPPKAPLCGALVLKDPNDERVPK